MRAVYLRTLVMVPTSSSPLPLSSPTVRVTKMFRLRLRAKVSWYSPHIASVQQAISYGSQANSGAIQQEG